MKTLFDIGDEISVTLKGKVVEYSASKGGDCYIIELTLSRNQRSRVYLSSSDLYDAKRIADELNVGDEVEIGFDNDRLKGKIISSDIQNDGKHYYTVELTAPDGLKSKAWFSDDNYKNSNKIRKA